MPRLLVRWGLPLATLVALVSLAIAQRGFFPSNPSVFSSISYSGGGPHIKSLSTSSTMTLDNSVTLMGSQPAGNGTADIISKPTNASRTGAIFETQNSVSTAGVRMFDTGRIFSESASSFGFLARATAASASGFEARDSANALLGIIGFAGSTDQSVFGSVAGDTIFTSNSNRYALGIQATAKPGKGYLFTTLRTTDGNQATCATLPLADNTAYKVESFVVARRSDGTAGRQIFWRTSCVFREGGGAAIGCGLIVVAADQSSGTTGSVFTVSVSGNNEVFIVQAFTGEQTDWTCFTSYEYTSTA